MDKPKKVKKCVTFSNDTKVNVYDKDIIDDSLFDSVSKFADNAPTQQIATNRVAKKHEQPFMINVVMNDMTAKPHIYCGFDYECVKELYEKTHDDSDIPIIYNFLYRYILQLPSTKPIVTYSPDQAISASTIAALSEKYMYTTSEGETVLFKSKLKVIYITSRSHVGTSLKPLNVTTSMNCILSNLMCLTEFTYTKHHMVIDPEQITLIGLNDDLLADSDVDEMLKLGIMYFTLQRIDKIGIKKIIDSVIESVANDPVHIVFDMSVMDTTSSPCVTRFLDKTVHSQILGLSLEHINVLFEEFSSLNIVGVDVTSYDFRYEANSIAYRVTCETVRKPLIKLLGVKQKSINIFDEHTRFLIWRPTYQKTNEDIGWFILRGMTLKDRENILASLSDDDIKIISIDNSDRSVDIDEDDVYVYIASTTMVEQEKKSYLTAESIIDCALFYEEKVNMMFEMLNVSQ